MLSGIVSGATVARAQVSLTDKDGSQQRTLLSGPNGEFTFAQIPSGSYLVLIKAPGFEPFTSAEILVTAQQTYDMPRILLPIATARTEMVVRPSETIAAEQVKAE